MNNGGLAVRIFAPRGGAGRDVPAPLPGDVQARLVQIIKQEIVKDHNPTKVLLECVGQSPILFVLEKFGTSGIIQWLTGVSKESPDISNGRLRAVSLALSGLDKASDDLAISTLSNTVDAVGNRMPNADNFVREARNELRPILMTNCLDLDMRANSFFLAAMQGLAQAFIDQFGIEGDKEEFDRRNGGNV